MYIVNCILTLLSYLNMSCYELPTNTSKTDDELLMRIVLASLTVLTDHHVHTLLPLLP